jgi:DNA-binding CsgD family transcriptional regulator
VKPEQPALTVLVLDAQDLTPRETAVLELLCQGHTRKEIARSRHRSYGTVAKHVESLARKLDAHSHAEIIAKAVAKGIVKLGLRMVVWLLVGLGVLSVVGYVRPPVAVEAVWHVR